MVGQGGKRSISMARNWGQKHLNRQCMWVYCDIVSWYTLHVSVLWHHAIVCVACECTMTPCHCIHCMWVHYAIMPLYTMHVSVLWHHTMVYIACECTVTSCHQMCAPWLVGLHQCSQQLSFHFSGPLVKLFAPEKLLETSQPVTSTQSQWNSGNKG